jgi:hypothetical protein
MANVQLYLKSEVFQVSALTLHQVCTKFSTKPLTTQYRVHSSVSTTNFQLFLSALEGEPIKVTKTNFKDFSSLCHEFGFEFENSSYLFAQFETTIDEMKTEIERLSSEIATLRGMFATTTQLSGAIAQLRSDFWSFPISCIVSDFPAIFEEFRGKHFKILWRGSRDGFDVSEFHRRCDGHTNTLTVILDTKGNIFGGFTPVEWESRSGFKGDDSLRSFLFTLKNSHNIPARRFVLKPENRDFAIECYSDYGPYFGSGADICVSDKCNVNADIYSSFGYTYKNDSGVEGEKLFAGSRNFEVKEIEVFEIIN